MIPNEAERLPQARAREVLARAAQLDASDRMTISVSELRAAAGEAGISAAALDRALGELHAAEPAPTSHARRGGLRRMVLIAAAVLLLGWTAIFALRMAVVFASGPDTEFIVVEPAGR
jgi:hypothetical protein